MTQSTTELCPRKTTNLSELRTWWGRLAVELAELAVLATKLLAFAGKDFIEGTLKRAVVALCVDDQETNHCFRTPRTRASTRPVHDTWVKPPTEKICWCDHDESSPLEAHGCSLVRAFPM